MVISERPARGVEVLRGCIAAAMGVEVVRGLEVMRGVEVIRDVDIVRGVEIVRDVGVERVVMGAEVGDIASCDNEACG